MKTPTENHGANAEPSAIAPVRVQHSVGLLPYAANLIREDILWHQGRRGSSGKTPDFEVGFIEGMYQAHGLIWKLMKQPNAELCHSASKTNQQRKEKQP